MMARLTSTVPPSVIRSAEGELDDLLNDLEALLQPGTQHPEYAASCTRPAILRRLAARVAEQIPAETDRIVAPLADSLLASAVSLHSGVPISLVDAASSTVIGDLYRGERIMLVAYQFDDEADQLSVWLTIRDQAPAGAVAVFGGSGAAPEPGRTILLAELPSGTRDDGPR